MRKRKSKTVLHPIMSFVVLIIFTIILSSILSFLDISVNYNMINTTNGSFSTTTVPVISMFNLTGIKTIFRTTVSNFVSFAPLSMLLIILIGIGIMDKSGFLEAFFTFLTRKSKKITITYTLALLTILASIMGDISYVIFIPIVALLFKYSKRNPKAGIIMAFSGLATGTGINVFMNSIGSSLLTYTTLAANSLDQYYTINIHCYLFIMIVLAIIMAFVITYITEYITIPKLGKYGSEEEVIEPLYLDKKKKRGLLFSITVASLYLLIFIYNIIPGLPLSGNLLDYSQKLYIDKLFGYNSFFNQGFVFIVTMLFFICGLFYGIGAKTIKNNQDVSNYLGHSLDSIGKMLVLLFFASTFISILKDTNIGSVLTAGIANFISKTHMTGIPLILTSFISISISTILLPSQVLSWSILSGVIVPVFMNAGMTPEFAELVFSGATSVTYGLTPVMGYFVIYLAFLDNYSEDDKPISFLGALKMILPYALAAALVWIVIIILAYIIGMPLGINSTAIL